VLVSATLRFEDGNAKALAQLGAEFTRLTGARLVFHADELPPGVYHDTMPALSEARQVRAAQIALREARKYPPLYFSKIGLKAIGIFAACASRQGDGFRQYDDQLQGYRYYGIWNCKDAVAAAYYSDGQLPLTLHHEVFHHVDATVQGRTDYQMHSRHDPSF